MTFDRLRFLGRTFRSLICEPRVTWSWIWGAYLQFAPPVLWFSPGRRQAVAWAKQVRDDERRAQQVLAEAARDAVLAELAAVKARLKDSADLHTLVRELVAVPHHRARTNRPPNRPN
ncbi:hypothetical protein ACFRAR_10270 [Kitasatospora sp. NPDC056651]|uniref:hypothetical protein n=1 Tax=Kitasatospora sp. NPDC056651 TaxID=3345892 RepID=UPI00369C0272